MIRRLFPYIDAGRWSGGTLSDTEGLAEAVEGWCICFQWFGFMIEIGAGRVEGRLEKREKAHG